jgi:mycobactin phenyloxazoline synthetase
VVHAPACSEDIRAEVAELLGVPADAVHPGSSLIGQGLDSIRMMTLAGRWRRRGIGIDFAALAATPTIEAWSELVTAGSSANGADQQADQPAAHVDASIEESGEPFPLAPMQHAMWVGRQDHQRLGGVAGHLYVEFDGGPTHPDRLRAAATRLARRHPMLRARFLPDGTQRIASTTECPDFPVTVEDLRHLAGDLVEQRLAGIRETKSQQQLDGAVFELALTLLPGERSRLHVDLDMQAADAMSYRTLMSDLAALYLGRDLPELGYTYREYRQAITREEAQPQPARDADRDWWAQRIPQLPDPPALPSIGGRYSRTSTRRWHWLDPATRDALFSRARARGVTPAMTLAAAFANALARWSATSRFLLNVPLFGRQALHPDVDLLVGDFTSSLLVDVDLTGAGTPAARAQVVQDAMRAAAAHSAYPGLSVLRDLSRHRGTQVLAPVVFTSALGLGELFSADVTTQFGRPGWIISQGPQVLLDAQVTESDDGVLVNWDVRDDAFAPGVVDAMFAHHIDELLRLAASDDLWDAPGPSALPAGQRAVRYAVNSRAAEPSGEALHDGFFRRAAHQPDAPAVFASSGDLSYAQLRDQALAVAAALRASGIGAGDTVAVMGPKTAEQVPGVLGILAAGGVYLPIGVDQPRDRAERILQTGGVNLALVCGGQRLSLPVPELTIADVLRNTRGVADVQPASSEPAELAYVLFTSGSTGEPKGVEMTHDGAMNTVEFLTRHFDIGAADRCLALSTLECDMSILDIFATLRAGGAIVVVDEAQRRDPDAWARLIDTHNVTVLNFLPGWLEMLVEGGHGTGVRPARGGLSSLRVVPTGGDWVRPGLARRLQALAPNVRFAGLGGATETAVHATIFEVAEEMPADWTAVPYGIPFPNIACRVVGDIGADCPDWVAGELWISGRGIARGYRGRSELTAERFVFHDGRIWYRTGDLARYWPDGTCEFVGRGDHRIKVSGYRVELGEIEVALRRVPGVCAAVAALVPGAGGCDVLAAQVCADAEHAGLTAERIREVLVDLVPAHMIPRYVSLVERIPFTDGGKIDRRAVAGQLAAAVAEQSDDTSAVYEAPRTQLERALCHIIAGLLNRDVCAVGVHDDFFSLGGDSVLATQAVAGIRRWLDSPSVMVADFFAARTVATLAQLLIGREARRGCKEDRLAQVADVYLEIAAMPSVDVLSALDSATGEGTTRWPAQREFKPWVKRFTGGTARGSVIVFPHAGGAAAAYRPLAKALLANDVDAFVVQYPQRADRRNHPAAGSIGALALELFEAGDWGSVAPLSLFGHCMGAVVAFEFARVAERNGVPVRVLWASAGQAPSTVAATGPLPTGACGVLADMMDLGGTDPVLLEDEEFVELLVRAVQADYRALNVYSCRPDVRVRTDIHAIGGNRDRRISREMLTSWETHTSGRFTRSYFEGDHFYLNDHLDAVARMVSADVR